MWRLAYDEDDENWYSVRVAAQQPLEEEEVLAAIVRLRAKVVDPALPPQQSPEPGEQTSQARFSTLTEHTGEWKQ